MTIIADAVQRIESREDFVAFLHALQCDLREDASSWEHGSLSSYLEALAAWVADMDGYFHHRGEPTPDRPSWKLLAQMLTAARVYE